jgi:hypothetical protein
MKITRSRKDNLEECLLNIEGLRVILGTDQGNETNWKSELYVHGI